jgi:hypothetical protein
MVEHKSSRTCERLAPLAIISSVRFSAANRDSACDGLVVFACFDSDSAGCTTLTVSLSCISWSGLSRDSRKLFISIRCRASQAHDGRRLSRVQKSAPRQGQLD